MSQTINAIHSIRFMLDMLDTKDRLFVLKQLNAETGSESQNEAPRIYSDKQVAERYGVHFRTARKWIATGKLKGYQLNGKWYSRADWLDTFDLEQSS